ncbi:MAG: creatininase family protein [Candidatus Brocadiia bacterium]
MEASVLYEELRPGQFRRRIAEAPIAYLPLGTLEWHGEHLPLGADGLQSQGFFVRLARRVGGIVLPMLFFGPDRSYGDQQPPLYGMDVCRQQPGEPGYYRSGQLAGSAYWVPDETFAALLDGIVAQLARAGFRIVVGHGHGPSTIHFGEQADRWRREHGLACFTCWGSEADEQGLGIQVDHAAMNETSLVMALRPELVDMGALPDDPDTWPRAIGGRDPRTEASPELGRRIIGKQLDRMEGILREALAAPG